ncbi:ssDNA-binding Zn-finger/Zn-ribbon topoisomerase 1/energy-coupling factor transporter ATP-binding protein EcfA2 [Variovorax sp. SG517]|uniref:toprim domain-containing protein n=1 Tax=Variovorax sp. SG517 TaxID=2587117 RepID=UPI00159EADA0|nr:toprim domain-containing protein [Variovorax sp. SG517]NVM93064.1 ssDNA-binding Zn-finger/Zn-ribbon topoisomerase 1/energy-coupling factor transporter ATP-binding protein EcfA2 [Variovorax sp. SG517]
MSGDLLDDIADALANDYEFKRTSDGRFLQKGICPSCGKKSLWTYAATPWVVRCDRLNNCGYEAHAKDLYPDFFNSWTERYQKPEQDKPSEQQNPTAAADAYLREGRGFDLSLIKGTYTQEHYFDARADRGNGAGTGTVRFQLAGTWWERFFDRPHRFGKKKANFKAGGSYAGTWWAMPGLSFVAPPPATPETAMAQAMQAASPAGPLRPSSPPPEELWLVEGIFDAIALAHHGIAAVALLSCNNYPEKALAEVKAVVEGQNGAVDLPRLVWAFDGDKAGQDFTLKYVRRAREAGWVCSAAQIPQRGKAKVDWNDLHQRGRLEENHLEDYRYHGALLLAATPQDKALLIYNRTGKQSFDFDHVNRLYWFKLDLDRFGKAEDRIKQAIAEGHTPPMGDEDLRTQALKESGVLQPIANCKPQALYYQKNEVTGEAWYYFRVTFPHDGPEVKGTFTAGQLTTGSEFKKQLLHMAAGAIYSGSSQQLEVMMQRQLDNIKTVQTVDFIGYSAVHKTYLLGKVAVREGAIHEANKDDYFDFEKLSIKTLQKSIQLQVNTDREGYERAWQKHLWSAFGAKGYIALAYWFGSLFAEQVRAEQQSFPFLEIVGEPGSGKTTLIQFLWKLCGRDYEGFDPSKSTSAGRLRTFTQVSNLPIVLIESDRETKSGGQAHVKSFDWDELKDAYNGNSIRTTGVKTGGNETYDPPFRASIVISQNNQVQASQAIMERICHMTFDTRGFTTASYESAKALEKIEIEQVSGFILAALKREADVMATIAADHDQNIQFLLAQDGIHKPRIAKNHAQLLSMSKALRAVVPLSDEQFSQVQAQIVAMARERQQAINADHPLVQEFWEAFDYLDALGVESVKHGHLDRPLLNHSRDGKQIAVNLNEFVEKANTHRQQIPLLAELKKVLRTSKTRRFVDIKSVNSAIRTTPNAEGPDTPKTVHCWVFEHPGRGA